MADSNAEVEILGAVGGEPARAEAGVCIDSEGLVGTAALMVADIGASNSACNFDFLRSRIAWHQDNEF